MPSKDVGGKGTVVFAGEVEVAEDGVPEPETVLDGIKEMSKYMEHT